MGLKDGLDDLVNPITESIEEFQNTLTLKSHEHLYKYIKSDNWLAKQIASQKDLQKSLIGIANAEAKKINRNYEEAFRLALKSGNEPISKGAIERLNKIKTDNAKMMLALTNQVYQSHQKWVNEIGLKANEKREIGKMEKSNSLFNQITDVLNSKKVEDEVKVVYKGGREVSFKTYMEMNVRTTMNQEIGKQQMEAAETLGVVFWLCNSFEDCRTQHIEFQGKVYYDERYVNYGFDAETIKQIEDAIDSREMMSRQEVENNDPFLSNCPNCRHEFMAIPIEDVIDKSDKELLEENGLNIDKATEQKYQLSQEQRLYERKIREYRLKVQKNKMELSKASYGIDTESVKKNLAHNQMMLDRYYGNIRGLVRKHSFLERDYKRESARVLRSDLGASSKYMAQAKPTNSKHNSNILMDNSLEDVMYQKSKKETLRYNIVETTVSDIVETKEYESLITDFIDNHSIKMTMISNSRQLLKRRNMTNGEESFIIGENGEIVFSNPPKNPCETNFNSSMKKVAEKGAVVLVHNHPNSLFVSNADLNTLYNNPKIKYGVILCHNGEVVVFQKGNKIMEDDEFFKMVGDIKYELLKQKMYTKDNFNIEVEKKLMLRLGCKIERRKIRNG